MTGHAGPVAAADLAAITDAARSAVTRVPADAVRYAEAELPGLLASLLALRAAAEGAALAVVLEAADRGVVAASSAAGLGQWVQTVADGVGVPVTGSEAGTWAHLAAECARPDSGVLRQACTSGRVPVAIGSFLGKELRGMRSQVEAGLWDACADALTGYAADGAAPAQLHRAVDVVLTQYGDGQWIETRTRQAHDRRGLSTFTPDRYGTWTARLTLDGDDLAQVSAVLDALSAPRPTPTTPTTGPEGTGPEGTRLEGTGRDVRTVVQRRADAFVQACALVAAQQRVPEELAGVGNGCAQVVITMDYERLREQTGHGMTLDGKPVTPSMVRRLACEGRIIPMVLGSDSQPLDVGREHRLATPAQVRALRQRDKGCCFPGCGRPPSWCQAHHLRHWPDGGPTDLNNLALLCQRHHTIVHRDGWVGTVTPHGVTWHLPDRNPPRHE